ncbi:MAG: hypothetical protein LBO07_04400 [Coriobacteriales bacterium]|nr:hypothetical protein [Coriobacteriales bacterium]
MNRAEFEWRKADLTRQIQNCRTQISQAQNNTSNSRAEIDRCNNEINALNGQITSCRDEITNHEDYIAQARGLLDRIVTRDTQTGDALNEVVRRVNLAQDFSTTMRFAQGYCKMMTEELASTKRAVGLYVDAAKLGIGRRMRERESAVNELTSQINSKNRRTSELRNKIYTLNNKIADNNTRIWNLNNRIGRLQSEIRILQQQVTT